MTYKNHIQLLLSVLLGALAFIVTSCSSSDPEIIPSEDTSLPMTFGSSVSATRALVETTDALKSSVGFGVFGLRKDPSAEVSDRVNQIFSNQKVYWEKGTDGKPKEATEGQNLWTYSPIKYWNTKENVTYDFGAYAPYKYKEDGVTNTTNNVFTIAVPQWQPINGSEYDLLVADNCNGPYSSFTGNDGKPDGVVKFDFKHKLAKLIIRATKVSSASVSNIDFYVTSLSLDGTNVKFPADDVSRVYTRDYSITDKTAVDYDSFNSVSSTDSSKSIFSIDEKQQGISVGTLGTENQYTELYSVLVAPFELGGELVINVGNYTINNEDPTPPDTPSRSTGSANTKITKFESGTVYYITLKLGAQQVSAEVTELQNWTEENVDTPVYNW